MAKLATRCRSLSLYCIQKRYCSTYVAVHKKKGTNEDDNEKLARSIEAQLGFKSKEDWYTLTKQQVLKIFGNHFSFLHYKRFLRKVYPRHHWDIPSFLFHQIPTRQKQLERVVRKLFPNERVIRNARKGVFIRDKETNAALEVDLWIPSLRLGFEYQDPHHYTTTSQSRDTLENYRKRDSFKKQVLSDRGDTLIEVPCWWDGLPESLAASIHAIRDDLLPHVKGDPINLTPPVDFIRKKFLVPDIGELMLATPMVSSIDVPKITNWWMSEKYAGVRGFWNPEKKMLYSRIGTEIPIPSSLLTSFPDNYLDGELWLGRGHLLQIVQILPRLSANADGPSISEISELDWSFFRYILFDAPDPQYINSPFEYRYSSLVAVFHSTNPTSPVSPSTFLSPSDPPPSLACCELATQQICENSSHFRQWVELVSEASCAGLVLREPESAYVSGRTQAMRTAKTSREAYAKIVAVIREPRELHGASAALVYACVRGDGESIECAADADFDLHVGDVVSYRYTRLNSQGLPILPEIYCVRHDLTWEDVVLGMAPLPKKEIEWTKRVAVSKAPPGYWKDSNNNRAFFDDYANKKGFDPLNPQNWYHTTGKAVNEAGWNSHKYRNAVVEAYPEVSFDTVQFHPKPVGFWLNANNVRDHFISAAKNLNIDPLVPGSWNDITQRQIESTIGCSVLIAHNYSLQAALKFAFPELAFDFVRPSRAYMRKLDNYRGFFNNYAAKRGFDPLIPKNWYHVTRQQIIRGGGRVALHAHGESHRRAIAAAFPNIGLQIDKWQTFRDKQRLNSHTRPYKSKYNSTESP